ncbi:hypothetical protein AMS68_004381 [Peltaster fructicola]|uniref:Uncharacterized protein n=1 Tax=Peltaster fructicola TaxID=286661 RepID=A0A6H0XVW3_9PEZI|nr:hypothetical protein AMS68_004381 [Peltaster fructicola]
MAAIPPKKTSTPNTAGSARKGGLSAGASADTPNRSPTRTPATTTTTTQPPMNRTRSVRTGNPPSARAAARRPASATPDAADEDAKAALQAKLEELQEQLRKAEVEATQAQEKASVLQLRLDEASKDQGRLEESVHEQLERINDLEVERKESLRAKREMEQIFESERIAVIREKEDMQTREDELRSSMQRLKETLAQRELRAGLEDDGRPGLQRNSSSRKSLTPSQAGEQFAPSSLERSDSRSSSKLVMQKDKIIEELRLELAEAQIRLVEVEHSGGGHMNKLQKEMYEVKMQNARLMEENESFQLLLSEKTLNGDFANGELFRPSSKAGSSPPASRQHGTLADELEATGEHDTSDDQRKLQAEANALKDQNKALTLYINNIVSRLLQHDQFEHILDKTPDLFSGKPPVVAASGNMDKELPPPPPEKDEPQGFLSRARSVLGARPARPQSQIIDSENLPPSLHTNPQTAPQIPLGRSQSTRHGHRRANSDWAAANIVNNMYRGPTTGVVSPASPGLASPTARAGGFFNAPQPLNPGLPQRVSSGTVPTIPESDAADKEKDGDTPTLQQRDSKLSRNSVISVHDTTAGSEALSNPSSPPRSVASGDQVRSSMANAPSVMVGSRMRPLRLVQENVMDDEAAKKAANRGSWFGFLNKGA